jgi:hypothetical protein
MSEGSRTGEIDRVGGADGPGKVHVAVRESRNDGAAMRIDDLDIGIKGIGFAPDNRCNLVASAYAGAEEWRALGIPDHPVDDRVLRHWNGNDQVTSRPDRTTAGGEGSDYSEETVK